MAKDGLKKRWDEIQKIIETFPFQTLPPLSGAEESSLFCFWAYKSDFTEFLDIAKKLDVRVLYIRTDTFDFNDIRSEVEIEYDIDLDNEKGFPSEVQEFLDSAQSHDSQMCLIVVTWIYQGVRHTYAEDIEWHTELSEQKKVVLKILKAWKEDADKKEEEEREKTLLKYAERLAKDPTFQKAKGGRDGRMIVAHKIFPDIDSHAIEDNKPALIHIVDKAWTLYRSGLNET